MKVKDLRYVIKGHIVLVDTYENDEVIMHGDMIQIPEEYLNDEVAKIYSKTLFNEIGHGIYTVISIYNHNSIY